MTRSNNIAILSDFGVHDNYNGVMEAIIRRINKHVNISYITNSSKKFNIIAAAYLLYTAYRFFPKYTVFLVTVDPTVGTERDVLITRTTNYFFVGPNNGVLYPSLIDDGIMKIIKVNDHKAFLSKGIIETFFDRYIFGISAALISTGVDMSAFGEEENVEDITKLPLKYLERTPQGVKGKVIYVDNFGNVTIGITSKDLPLEENKLYTIFVRGKSHKAVSRRTFAYGNEGELTLYTNEYGFLEVGINKGSAYDTLKTSEGDEICLEDYTQEDSNHSI